MKTEFLLELIKNEWADIHHTRNQEWTSLAIIGGIIYALFQVKKEYSPLPEVITVFGLIACVLSIYMLCRHWLLFKTKMKFITLLEREIGVGFEFYKHQFKIPVQAIIMLFYFLLSSALAGWFTYLLSDNKCGAGLVSVLVFSIGIFICCLIHLWIEKNVKEKVWVNITDKKNGKEKTLKIINNLEDFSNREQDG